MFGTFYVVLSAVAAKSIDLSQFFGKMNVFGYEFIGDMGVLGGVTKMSFKLVGEVHEDSVKQELTLIRACALNCNAISVEVQCRDESLFWVLNPERKLLVYDV